MLIRCSVSVVKFKHTRGKVRPVAKHLEANADDAVMQISGDAFATKNVRQALDKLCELRGVVR